VPAEIAAQGPPQMGQGGFFENNPMFVDLLIFGILFKCHRYSADELLSFAGEQSIRKSEFRFFNLRSAAL
jgi:hypothetical protein